MDPSSEDSSATAMTDFCKTCHQYQTEEKFVHGPIPVGGCPSCHNFKSAPHRYDLTAEGTGLCFTCHSDIQGKFDRPFVHGPVAMGLCTACHSPHSSPFKFQLIQPQTTLCVGCHEDMRAKLGKFQLHKPITQENCTACHDPHSSDNETYFLKGKGTELCYMCHSKEKMKNHAHPVEGPPPFTVPGMKLDAKGNLSCFSCHDPHSSDEKRLFTVKGGCDGCHNLSNQQAPATNTEEQ
jgi:predicted CXXCH cytochrome family protein